MGEHSVRARNGSTKKLGLEDRTDHEADGIPDAQTPGDEEKDGEDVLNEGEEEKARDVSRVSVAVDVLE